MWSLKAWLWGKPSAVKAGIRKVGAKSATSPDPGRPCDALWSLPVSRVSRLCLHLPKQSPQEAITPLPPPKSRVWLKASVLSSLTFCS